MKTPTLRCRTISAALLLLSLPLGVLAAPPTNYPVPFINQPLVPDAAAPGGEGLTLIVNGTGFSSGSLIQWNGSSQATTFVSASQLTATITAAEIATAGTAYVTVLNPSPGGGESNVAVFSITSTTPALFFSGTQSPTGQLPNWVAVADFNGDRKPDLALTNSGASTISMLLGNGDGTFQPAVFYPVGFGPEELVTGDFNNDGKLDLAVTNGGDDDVSVLLGNGDGTFGLQQTFVVGSFPQGITTADVNRDGKLDLLVNNAFDDTVSVLLGNGDGTFQPQVAYYTGGGGTPVVGDFNGDGNLDFADLANGAVAVALGNGDGTFGAPAYYSAAPYAEALVTGDFNGDTILDLITANMASDPLTDGTISVLLGNGDGTFQNPISYAAGAAPHMMVTVDLNADGKLDLAIANLDSNSISTLLGNGDGTFQPHVDQPALNASGPVCLAMGDFNLDGRLDLALVGQSLNSVSALLGTGAVPTPAMLNFGGVGRGSGASQVVALTDDQVSPITLSTISIGGANDGDFSQTNNCPPSLSLGLSCSVTVTFQPKGYGNRSAALSFTDNAAGSPQTVPLTGFGNAPLAYLAPTALNFPQQLVETTSPAEDVTLTNEGTLALNISGITLTGGDASDFLQSNNCPARLPVSGSCTISVALRPLKAGTLSAQLAVTDNAPGSPQSVSLSGKGTFFELSPTSVNFGSVPVGQTSAPQTVTLTNKAKTTQAVSGIRIQGGIPGEFAETNNCGSSLGAGASCAITVTFTPPTKGYHYATLQVNGGGGGVLSAPLSGTGT